MRRAQLQNYFQLGGTSIVFLLILISCNRESAPDCFKSAGKEKTVRRPLNEFQSIEIRDFIHVELVDSNAWFVEITAPGNLIPKVETTVENGKLYISNSNTCNFVRSFKKTLSIRIFAPQFPDIQNYGTGNITSLNTLTGNFFKLENRQAAGTSTLKLQCDSIAIYTHTGVTDAIVSGTVQRAEFFNQGLGIIDARNLNANNVFVNNSSINDIYVKFQDYLFAHIEFSGNIYYSGPDIHIDQDIIGNGQLIELPQ